MKFLKTISVQLTLLMLMAGSALAQPVDARPQKVDEFGDMKADDERARLDHFAKALAASPGARGYIICYSQKDYPLGLLLRGLYGYRDYLINSRGMAPELIEVVAGGNKDRVTTELWLVPKGASAPKPESQLTVSPTAPLKFDTIYPDCPSEFTINLEEIDDYLRFYVEAWRGNPNAQGRIIVYPGRRSRLTQAERMARETRKLLMRKHNISGARVVAEARSRRRECSEIELWIVPVRTFPAKATHNNGRYLTDDTLPVSYFQSFGAAGDTGR